MSVTTPEPAGHRPREPSGRQGLPGRAEGEAGELARRIIDALPVLIAYIDRDQRYAFANTAYEVWFGIERNRLLGRTVREVLGAAAYEVAQGRIERALAGEAVTFENTLQPAGGSPRHVLASLVPDFGPDRKVQGLCVVVSDVTPQDQAETDAHRLAAIVEASADSIVSATLDGIFTSWNASAEKLFGYTAAEALGGPISIILPPDRLGERERVIERLRRGERVEPFESVRVHKSGRCIPVSVGFAPVTDADGRLVGVAATARDISERKRVEEQLQARARQQDAVASLGNAALAGARLDETLERATRLVAETLGVEFVKVMELAPCGHELVFRAGCGWHGVEIGTTTVSADVKTQAGYTLASGRPVIVLDLGTETRFVGAPLLHEHGAKSGLSVIIAGEEGHAYGVLEAHTTRRHEFTSDDVRFLEAVANVLASAIQRRRAEDLQGLLLAELSHRVKNTLAVVQSLAAITGERATSIPAFLDSFRGPLAALAATHSLLTSSHWRGADLEGLARAVLAPHVASDRIHLQLEGIVLKPAAAQTFSLLLQELVTNAGKYGALAAPGGTVTLTAAVADADQGDQLRLVWREDGGPRVRRPARRGFGTSVLFRAIEHQHDGKVRVDWRPAGLICEVRVPLQEAVAGHEPAVSPAVSARASR